MSHPCQPRGNGEKAGGGKGNRRGHLGRKVTSRIMKGNEGKHHFTKKGGWNLSWGEGKGTERSPTLFPIIDH